MNNSLKRLLLLQKGFTSNQKLSQKVQKNVSQYKNFFNQSAYMIPHPEKAHKGGEDAYYSNSKLLCVCDGVGGWANHGVDPGLYSKSFAKHTGNLFNEKQQYYIENPKQLLIDAHQKTKEVGSTTVCMLTIDDTDEDQLKSSYIGDSGYVIYRKTSQTTFETIFVSEEQQKSFNFPYQVGSEGDNPSKSLVFEHNIKHNDLIVTGTDGLFDNVDEKQILKCIQPFWESHDTIQDLSIVSEIIAKFAFKLSLDPTYYSPFAKKARKSFYDFAGGKSDDITVIVAQVQQSSHLQN